MPGLIAVVLLVPWLLLCAIVVYSGLMGWTWQTLGAGAVLALLSGIISGVVSWRYPLKKEDQSDE